MPKRKTPAPQNDLSRADLMFARLALFLALGISAFLAWNAFQGGGVPGCGPESDCDKVLSSRWAYLFGLPVSLFAIPVYALVIFATFRKPVPWRIVLPLALVILVAALWFIGLQKVSLRAFCKFCMIAHVAGAIAAVLLIRKNPLERPLPSIALAAVAVTALIAGQLAAPAPAPLVIASTVAPPTNAPVALTTNAPPAPADPIFSVVDGQFPLNLAKVPVEGPLNAPKKLAKLFDYTCHHCRDLHHLLKDFRQKHSNDLAVISLPVPLDSNCNPSMKRTPSAHVNACEYARLGLAVFFAQPAKFHEFSDWVFAPPHPPDLAATRTFAENLVGKTELAEKLNSPQPNDQIKTDVTIYIASSRLAGKGAMPQMLFTRGGSIGAVSDAAQLEKIMFDNLGLGTPR